MGVTVEVDVSAFEDVRFMTAMARLSDETVPEDEKMVWYARALEVIFGGKTYAVQCDLAKAHDGRLTHDDFSAFFSELMEEVASKN